MRTSLLVVVSLLVGLAACTDHLQPTEPTSQPQTRLRLKRTVSTSPGFPGTTEFVYDQQGRQTAFIYLGDRADFTYNAASRLSSILFAYQTTVDITGEQTLFSYNDAQRQVRSTLSLLTTVNGQYTPSSQLKTSTYTFDTSFNKPVSLVDSSRNPATVSTTTYTFTGDNLTRTRNQSSSQPNQTAFDYSYDDKPNPFYGLIGPGITDARRFSRNNVAKTVVTNGLGTATESQSQLMIQYEYNAQGLPTRAVAGPTQLTYEYETY